MAFQDEVQRSSGAEVGGFRCFGGRRVWSSGAGVAGDVRV